MNGQVPQNGQVTTQEQAADRAVIGQHLLEASPLDFIGFAAAASGVPVGKLGQVQAQGDMITLPTHDPLSGAKPDDFDPFIVPRSFGLKAEPAGSGKITFDGAAVMAMAWPVLGATTPEEKKTALAAMWSDIDHMKTRATGRPRLFSDLASRNGHASKGVMAFRGIP